MHRRPARRQLVTHGDARLLDMVKGLDCEPKLKHVSLPRCALADRKNTTDFEIYERRTAFFMLCAFSVSVTECDRVPSCLDFFALAY